MNGSTYQDKRELVSSYLREADKLLKIKDFTEATNLVNKANAIDPNNPYVKAFLERIEHFKNMVSSDVNTPTPKEIQTIVPEKKEDIKSLAEDSIRQQIESEYQTKFREELIKIENKIANKLEEEKQKLEKEKEQIQKHFEEQNKNIKTKLEAEYNRKLEHEISITEQRLKEQFLAEQEFLEKEMKTRLEKEFSKKIQDLEREYENKINFLLDNEKYTYSKKEEEIKKIYEEKLQTEINKLKIEQEKYSLEHLQEEKEKIKNSIAEEYEKHLQEEKEKIRLFYENEKSNLQKQLAEKQKELEEKNQRVLTTELTRLREREKKELAKKQFEIEENIRNELTIYYNEQIELERKRLNDKVKKFLEEKEKQLKLEEEKLIIQENKKVEEIRATLKQEMEKKYLQKLEQLQEQFTKAYDYKMELLGVQIPTEITEKYNLYKKRLREFWENGQPSVDQARKLMGLKELLELTFDEHAQLETDVRHELYVTTVEKGIHKNEIDPADKEYLERLKTKFQIAPEEALKLESYILSLFMKISVMGVILIIDDDEALLSVLTNELINHKYRVLTATNGRDALEILQKNSVDLILCDIKFPEGEMDGFTIFSIVQKNPILNRIPFILMSALGDGGIIRSGKLLGVDDYLTKPLDMDLLLSVIEGKIKRYRNIFT